MLAQGRVADIERRLRFGAVLRVRLLLDGTRPSRRPATGSPADARRRVGRRSSRTARSSSASAATTTASARLLADVGRRPGMPIVSFARAASDLEELFLQVTAPDRQPLEAAVGARHDRDDRTDRHARRSDGVGGGRSPGRAARRRSPGFGRTAGGIAAVGVKELRGRMRGRRAFVILTIYLLLLGGFAWMVELIMERTYSTGFGGNVGRSRPRPSARASSPRC